MEDHSCGSIEHIRRRTLLKMAGLSGLSWLTPLGTALARHSEHNPSKRPLSLIVLWLEGAPSQLETFDPHPDTEIAAGSKAIKSRAPGILLGEGLVQTAEQMDSISLVRALTSREGDHERAIYNIKTGFRMDPTLKHPSIGSIICHQLHTDRDRTVDIPRHISILPGQMPGRGGYLGDQFDAFKVNDPVNPISDINAWVDDSEQKSRLKDLSFLDKHFLERNKNNKAVAGSLGTHQQQAALKMMSSEQLEAFNVKDVSESERLAYGDSPFGRSCLAALRLIEKGVRCVEVTLGGWDTHANNHELQAGRINVLDPAFANLIKELKKRDLLETTMVVCGGEFGRTPHVNPLGGRDHWPHGFSMAMAGGGVQGGRVIGETSPIVSKTETKPKSLLKDSHPVKDIHATILSQMGIDYEQELDTPIGRPLAVCEGSPITSLLDV
ncbi:DUF1501 domain-containing protein [Mariniblastus fucicola]|nr:DUF1501 domain-containing protein [Mariniblastus fucicola]